MAQTLSFSTPASPVIGERVSVDGARKKTPITFSTPSMSSPTIAPTKTLFTPSQKDSERWLNLCAPFSIVDKRDVSVVRELVERLDGDTSLVFLNFGDVLQHEVESTNSALLQWGNENLKSPLNVLYDKTSELCQQFQRVLNPGSNFFGVKKTIDFAQARILLERTNAEIDHFNAALRMKKNSQDAAHAALNTLMKDTDRLIKQLDLHRVAIDLKIPMLDADLLTLQVESSSTDRNARHLTQESKDILMSKKGSFSTLHSSLMLQITQVQQLMTQQRQKILQYQDIASVTFPLWRTQALACLSQHDQSQRETAIQAFSNTHTTLFQPAA
jgi:hypothetical protein